MSLKDQISDLKEANELVNKLYYALSEGIVDNDLFERINRELSFEKIKGVLHNLLWSSLSINELLRYFGAFRLDISKAISKLSELNSDNFGNKELTPEQRNTVATKMEVIDRGIVEYILFISNGFGYSKSDITDDRAKQYKSVSNDMTFGRNLEKVINEQKIATLLSVKQLGFWIRLQKDHGILDGDNIALLVRQFALNYSSKRTENVSEQSLYNEYFDTSQVDAAVIRAILKSMLQYIDKEFFS